MKKLFVVFAAMAMVGLLAVSCKKGNEPNPTPGISIKFAPTELSLMEGAVSDPIAVTVVPETRKGELRWFVSDQAIADIDVNTLKVKALKEGTCTITAKLFDANNKMEASADLKVTVAPNVNNQVTNVNITPEKLQVALGATKDITISVLPKDAKYDGIVVASADEKIATVAKKQGAEGNVYVVTPVAVGNTTITATVAGKAGKCEVEVVAKGDNRYIVDIYFPVYSQIMDYQERIMSAMAEKWDVDEENNKEGVNWVFKCKEEFAQQMAFWIASYVYKPSKGAKFSYYIGAKKPGDMSAEVGESILEKYGFTSNVQSGTLTSGEAAVQATNKDINVDGLLYWEDKELSGQKLTVLTFQASDSNGSKSKSVFNVVSGKTIFSGVSKVNAIPELERYLQVRR